MDKNWYFKAGSWNALCDVCGFKFKSDELKDRWDGLKVCSKDWEPRHIMDFFTIQPDHMEIPWARPDATNPSVGQTQNYALGDRFLGEIDLGD